MAANVTQHAIEVFVDQDLTAINETVTGGAVTQHVLELFVSPSSSPQSLVSLHAIEVYAIDTQSQETAIPGGGGGGTRGWVSTG